MSKLFRINMNVDTSNVVKNLLINKEEKLEAGGFAEYSPAEYWKNIVMQAISMAHPHGNLAVLRRTRSIARQIDEAIAKDGLLSVNEEDKRYLQSSMDKADKWNNSLGIADSVSVVYEAITNAESVE